MASKDGRQYELGVADVVRHKVGDGATVTHNERVVGRSGEARQIDVSVRGSLFGLSDALLVIDCKDHGRPVSVAAVDAFRGLAEDVGADLAFIVSASGFTRTARARAEQLRHRLVGLTRDELAQWVPPNTRFAVFAVRVEDEGDAVRALVQADYRVKQHGAVSRETVEVEAFRLADPADAEPFVRGAEAALRDAGIAPDTRRSGIVIGGGTPHHAWVPVYFSGWASPVLVQAATEKELAEQLVYVSRGLGLPVDLLEVRRPEGWPRDMWGL